MRDETTSLPRSQSNPRLPNSQFGTDNTSNFINHIIFTFRHGLHHHDAWLRFTCRRRESGSNPAIFDEDVQSVWGLDRAKGERRSVRGFPVCRPCYEYERSDGNQCCPQCNTCYKRLKGSPRIPGDEDDNSDQEDFDHEFQIKNRKDDSDNQQWHRNGQAFSVAGSTGGKDLEGDKETYGSAEWEERVEKWKVRQEKRGLISNDNGGNDLPEEDCHNRF